MQLVKPQLSNLYIEARAKPCREKRFHKEDLVWEGSILLSTCPITGTTALGKLRHQLLEWLEVKVIRNRATTKILILSGTHGSGDGRSVLTDLSLKVKNFFVNDCSNVGFSWREEVTDVNAVRKVRKTLRDCFINIEAFNEMTFQVYSMWQNITRTKISSSRTSNDPADRSLRRLLFLHELGRDNGLAGVRRVLVLVIEEELRRITGRPDATLDPQQVECGVDRGDGGGEVEKPGGVWRPRHGENHPGLSGSPDQGQPAEEGRKTGQTDHCNVGTS